MPTQRTMDKLWVSDMSLPPGPHQCSYWCFLTCGMTCNLCQSHTGSESSSNSRKEMLPKPITIVTSESSSTCFVRPEEFSFGPSHAVTTQTPAQVAQPLLLQVQRHWYFSLLKMITWQWSDQANVDLNFSQFLCTCCCVSCELQWGLLKEGLWKLSVREDPAV